MHGNRISPAATALLLLALPDAACPSCHAKRLAWWSLWLDETLLASGRSPSHPEDA